MLKLNRKAVSFNCKLIKFDVTLPGLDPNPSSRKNPPFPYMLCEQSAVTYPPVARSVFFQNNSAPFFLKWTLSPPPFFFFFQKKFQYNFNLTEQSKNFNSTAVGWRDLPKPTANIYLFFFFYLAFLTDQFERLNLPSVQFQLLAALSERQFFTWENDIIWLWYGMKL